MLRWMYEPIISGIIFFVDFFLDNKKIAVYAGKR